MKTQNRVPAGETAEPPCIDACVARVVSGSQAVCLFVLSLTLLVGPIALAQGGIADRSSSLASTSLAGFERFTPSSASVPVASDTVAAESGQRAPARRNSAGRNSAGRNPVRLGADGLPEPARQLPDLGRLRTQLHQEAMIEGFLGESDRRDLMEVRAFVDRTGRLPGQTLQEQTMDFDHSRRAVQQTAKEAFREYVKMRVGWDAMQDRMKVRVKNLFRRGEGQPARVPHTAPVEPIEYASGFDALEVGPEINLDSDDAEIGLDFDYDPGRITFLSRWDLYYGRTLSEGKDEVRLRYNNGDSKRWFELSAGRNDREVGNYVGLSFTALF